jgi:hypothetical protein
MNRKRRSHDAIAGAVITLVVALGYYSSSWRLIVPTLLGITLLQSGFTGFCPVYYVFDKVGPRD